MEGIRVEVREHNRRDQMEAAVERSGVEVRDDVRRPHLKRGTTPATRSCGEGRRPAPQAAASSRKMIEDEKMNR